jgi:hypothetical protein
VKRRASVIKTEQYTATGIAALYMGLRILKTDELKQTSNLY